MSNYDNTNTGAIWGNDKKESDKHPDFKGSVNVEGVEYWVSGWKRGPNDNPKGPSLKFKLKKKEAVHDQGIRNTREAVDQFDDFEDPSIPF